VLKIQAKQITEGRIPSTSNLQPLIPMFSASVNPSEIAQFSRLAPDWWNPQGAMKPLHKMNPARLEYVRDQICAYSGRQAGGRDVLQGLTVLDVGCGAGLLCEPLARLGAKATGLDASRDAIEAACAHATQSKLDITYICDSVEMLAKGKQRFDVITALEILEHVEDLESFLNGVAALLKPNGLLILSTLNRTPQSFLLGIVAAEYMMKWVPRGTHNWRKFIKPSELAARLEHVGLTAKDITGVVYDPLNDTFTRRQEKVGMNYLVSAVKA